MSGEKHCIDVSSGAAAMPEVKDTEDWMDQDEQTVTVEGAEDQEEEKSIKEEEFEDYSKTSHIDEEEEPKMITIRGTNKDYLSARRKINETLRTASFHRGFKKALTTSFKVTDFKNQQYASEFDVEVKMDGKKGKAKVTIYKDNKKKEGKKQQTIMITKKARNESINVRKVSENVIQPLLEGFIRKEVKLEDIVNETKEESEATCDICNKKCINDQGLALHKSRMHDQKKIKVMDLTYECDKCEGKFQMEKLLTEHIKKFHKKVSDVGQSESIKRVNSTSPGEDKKRKKVEKLLGEYQKYKKESEKKYNDLKEENQKLRVENDRLQTEKTIAESKQLAEANIRKTNENTAKRKNTVDDMSECIDQFNSMNIVEMKNIGG